MKCPGCGFRIEINAEPEDADIPSTFADLPESTPEEQPEQPEAGVKPSHGLDGDLDDEEAGYENFEPGVKTALVYCPTYDTMIMIKKGMQQLGYEIRRCSSAKDVRARFRYHIYDLLILYNAGREPDGQLTDILKWVNNTSMDVRRRVLVLYLSINANLNDTMRAFSMGVDAMVNSLELANLPSILEKIEKRRESTYRVFNECLKKVKEDVF